MRRNAAVKAAAGAALILASGLFAWRFRSVQREQEAWVQVQNLGAEIDGVPGGIRRVHFPGGLVETDGAVGPGGLRVEDVDLFPHLGPVREVDLSGVPASPEAVAFLRTHSGRLRGADAASDR